MRRFLMTLVLLGIFGTATPLVNRANAEITAESVNLGNTTKIRVEGCDFTKFFDQLDIYFTEKAVPDSKLEFLSTESRKLGSHYFKIQIVNCPLITAEKSASRIFMPDGPLDLSTTYKFTLDIPVIHHPLSKGDILFVEVTLQVYTAVPYSAWKRTTQYLYDTGYPIDIIGIAYLEAKQRNIGSLSLLIVPDEIRDHVSGFELFKLKNRP